MWRNLNEIGLEFSRFNTNQMCYQSNWDIVAVKMYSVPLVVCSFMLHLNSSRHSFLLYMFVWLFSSWSANICRKWRNKCVILVLISMRFSTLCCCSFHLIEYSSWLISTYMYPNDHFSRSRLLSSLIFLLTGLPHTCTHTPQLQHDI